MPDFDAMPQMEPEGDWGQRLLFRSRIERVDDLARALLQSWGIAFDNLESVQHGRPITLEALFEEPLGWSADHFGALANQISSLVYVLFIASDTYGSAGFTPKSPRVADIWKPVLGGSDTTVYLALGDADTVLVACPQVPDVLLGKDQADFQTSLRALRSLAAEIVDRFNLITPPAVVLRARGLTSFDEAT